MSLENEKKSACQVPFFIAFVDFRLRIDDNEANPNFQQILPMAVFKMTDQAGALMGGANRDAGLQNLNKLNREQSRSLLEGLRANLSGVDGNPKHGVLKLRNSSSANRQMEFARMRGMDRWFSKDNTFENTAKALKLLIVRSGTNQNDADGYLRQYLAKDGSIKCKDAIQLINRVLPVQAEGKSLANALTAAGIEPPQEALEDKIVLRKDAHGQKIYANDENSGGMGVVFPAKDHNTPCMIKRFEKPQNISIGENGVPRRYKGMDANHLAAGKIPGVIAANRYIISKTDNEKGKTFHVVNAGKQFKDFCKENPEGDVKLEGLVMDQAKGTRMFDTLSTASEKKQIARDLTAILMNASSHGLVFLDIKAENAFVHKGKLTLIDTDGAFKHSQKKPESNPGSDESPRAIMTYKFPSLRAKVRIGQQQDLWSAGFTLLEHASEKNLFEIGGMKDKALTTYHGLPPGSDKIKHIEDKILTKMGYTEGSRPAEDSVEDFALLCIRTALTQLDAPYNTRFVGGEEDKHLLDPILNHPLIGGRQAFIDRHLVRKDLSPSPSISNKDDSKILFPHIKEKGSIDQEFFQGDIPVSDEQPIGGKRPVDDDDLTSNDSDENLPIIDSKVYLNILNNYENKTDDF
jgi:hypothetical protein